MEWITHRARGPDGPVRLRALLPMLLLSLCATAGVAQQPADPIETCSQVTDTIARLACFDKLAAQRRAGSHGNSASPSAPMVTTGRIAPAAPPDHAMAAPQSSEDTTGLDPEQIRKRRKQEGLPVESTKVVVSTVARLDAQPSRHYHFELDNGQVWASTDAEPVLFLKPHETVRINSGLFGAFFLSTASGTTMRVYRLR